MYGREYRKKFPEKGRVYVENRRARLLKAEGQYTSRDVERLRWFQDDCCYYCSQKLDYNTPKQVHVEHMIPLFRGGSNRPNNLCLSCKQCNDRKGKKTHDEFLALLDSEREVA